MKKILFIAALTAVAAGLSSCNKGRVHADLKTDIDTVSYELGLSGSNGIEAYLLQNEIDSAYLQDFLAGVKEGAMIDEKKKKEMARFLGMSVGVQLARQIVPMTEQRMFVGDSTQHLSMKNFLSGFMAGVRKKSALKINGKVYDAEMANRDVQERIGAITDRNMERRYGADKKKAADYMAAKAKEDGINKLPGGVLYRVITAGTGAKPTAAQSVMVEYEGKLIDGKVFDSTFERQPGKPVELPIGAVVEGMRTALLQMPVGSEWEIFIPYDKGYGAQGMGGDVIPPFSNLIFRVKLHSISESKPAAAGMPAGVEVMPN